MYLCKIFILSSKNGDCCCRVKFIQCNRSAYYVLQISVRAGAPTQIYADGENNVSSEVLLIILLLTA